MGKFEFSLRDRVKSSISGFKGIVTARVEYLYGNNRYQVTAERVETGSGPASEWFDEGELTLN